MELKGWKARVVLAAAILHLINLLITVPAFIAFAVMHH